MAVEDFWRGLTEPSGPVLGLAVVVGLALAAAVPAAIDDAMLRDRPGRFATDPRDDAAFTTARMLRMDEASTAPAILVLGGSAVREALTSPEALIHEVVERGVRAEVHVVASADQTLYLSDAIFDRAPRGGGMLVLGMGAYRVAPLPHLQQAEADAPRFGVDLPRLREHLAEDGVVAKPWAVGRWASPRLSFLLPRAWHAVGRWGSGDVLEATNWWPYGSPPIAQVVFEDYAAWLRDVPESVVVDQFQAAEALVRRARDAGYDVALLRTPANPTYFPPDVAQAMGALDRRVDEWAKGHGLDWVDPGVGLDIGPRDLIDWCHLNHAEKEAAWTSALADALASRWERL